MTLHDERTAEAELLRLLLAGDPNTFTAAEWGQLATRAHRLLDLLNENPGPGDERQRRLCWGVATAVHDPFHPSVAVLERALWHYLTDPDEDDYFDDDYCDCYHEDC
jgi:hypothetical protein